MTPAFTQTKVFSHKIVTSGYADLFCRLHFAHLALVAALIRAKPAAEMRRLRAIETTSCRSRHCEISLFASFAAETSVTFSV
jgi:hypothetical protein